MMIVDSERTTYRVLIHDLQIPFQFHICFTNRFLSCVPGSTNFSLWKEKSGHMRCRWKRITIRGVMREFGIRFWLIMRTV